MFVLRQGLFPQKMSKKQVFYWSFLVLSGPIPVLVAVSGFEWVNPGFEGPLGGGGRILLAGIRAPICGFSLVATSSDPIISENSRWLYLP